MGKKSRTKGSVFEREVVNAAKDVGLSAFRIPLSGAMDGFPYDVNIEGLNAECKIRANGFKELYGWIDAEGADLLVIRADRKQRLYVLREDVFYSLVGSKGRPD